MKKIIAVFVCMCLTLGLGCFNTFAVNEKRESSVLFSEDFEGYAAEAAADSFNNGSADADAKAEATAIKATDGNLTNETMVGELMTGARIGAIFGDGKTVFRGSVVIEFDSNMAAGNVWFSLLYADSLGTREKWFAGSTTSAMGTITDKLSVPTSNNGNYQTFTDADTNQIDFVYGDWAHYKIVADLDSNSVTVCVDDTQSESVTGYTYLTAEEIGVIGIYNASQGSRYIDNLKIYADDGYRVYFAEDDMESYTLNENIPNIRDEAEGGVYSYWSSSPTSWPATVMSVRKVEARCPNASDESIIETPVPDDPDNKVLKIGNNTAMQANFGTAVSEGVLCVEADLLGGNGGFGIGIRQEGDTSINWKYPFWAYRNFIRASAFVKEGEFSSGNLEHYMIDGNIVAVDRYLWFNVRLFIDTKTGDCWINCNGKTSDKINIPYIGTDNTTAGTKNPAISAVALYNTRSSSVKDLDCFADNFKVSIPSDGLSVSALNNGKSKLRLQFKDDINPDTVSVESVSVRNGGGAVSINDITVDETDSSVVIIELANDITPGDTFTVSVSDAIKYADGYSVIAGEYGLAAAESGFSAELEITEPKYTAGETVKARLIVDSTDLEARSIDFILGAFTNNMLVDVDDNIVVIPDSLYGEMTYDIEYVLKNDADLLQAFAWSDELVPFTQNARAEK